MNGSKGACSLGCAACGLAIDELRVDAGVLDGIARDGSADGVASGWIVTEGAFAVAVVVRSALSS